MGLWLTHMVFTASYVERLWTGKITRYHALNDLVARASPLPVSQSSKEPHGLVLWSDGKWPDGLTLVPLKGGKPLAWNITSICRCTMADSYVAAMAKEAGS